MARSDAVSAVTGEIFREGWSKVRGSMQGLGQKRPQMVRAAKGHRSAVFKPVRSGGCQTKKELTNQLEYLTTKSSHIVDSRGVLDGKRQLSADEIKSVVDRFSGRWSEGFRPKMGHTTHMLMSYPKGTKGEDVRDITAAVSERFFANDDRNFDYIIAIHEDRDHPHAHIVINRKSQEGEFFYLGRDHHFNYLKDTADQYGDMMRSALLRQDTREFREHEHEDYEAYSEASQKFEQERLREFDNAVRPYRTDQIESAEMRRVIEHEKVEKIDGPFDQFGGEHTFRDDVERELNDEQLEALKKGDADALSEVIDNRLDRLYAAKAYLQSDEATANNEATREVISEINDEEYDAVRLKQVHANTEKGQTHG